MPKDGSISLWMFWGARSRSWPDHAGVTRKLARQTKKSGARGALQAAFAKQERPPLSPTTYNQARATGFEGQPFHQKVLQDDRAPLRS